MTRKGPETPGSIFIRENYSGYNGKNLFNAYLRKDGINNGRNHFDSSRNN